MWGHLLMTEAGSPVTRSTPSAPAGLTEWSAGSCWLKGELLKGTDLIVTQVLEKTKKKKYHHLERRTPSLPHSGHSHPPARWAKAVPNHWQPGLMEETFGSQPVKLPSSDPCTLPFCPQGSGSPFLHPAPWHRPLPTMEMLHQGIRVSQLPGVRLSSSLSH